MHPWKAAAVVVLTVLFLFYEARGQTDSCAPCECSSITNCTGDLPEDDCDCCRRCKDVGDICGDEIGHCIGNLLCLPDDPYSTDYKGKCYELSECLSFGCTDETGECNCLYSSECPLKRFPYYTLEECIESLMKKKCLEVDCQPQLTAQDCHEGMYFEQGPSYFDDCCPVSGSCVCNVSMCDAPPVCESNGKLMIVKKATGSDGECCDQYKCEKAPGCFHENKQYELNESWKETACRECHCTMDGVYCTYTNCSQLENCEITYIPEGACCPVCLEVADPSEMPIMGKPLIDSEDSCVSDDGLVFNNGQVFQLGSCRMCKCEDGHFMCEEKSCEPLVCGINEMYEVVADECCPKCIDKTTVPTMNDNIKQTMVEPSTVTSHSPTPDTTIDIKETTMLPPVTPSNNSMTNLNLAPNLEVVMILDASFAEVNSKWIEFSVDLTSMLQSTYSLTPLSMNVREDMGMAVLIINVDNNSTNKGQDMSSNEKKSQLALMISRVAQNYSFVEQLEIDSDYHHSHNSPLGIDDMEYNATVIVLTLVAAVALISFIGIFIGLILITRRLKTMKAIKGHIYKKPTARP